MQTFIQFVTKVDFFSPCGSEGIASVFLLTSLILVLWTFLGDLGLETLTPLQLVNSRFVFCLIRKWFLALDSCFLQRFLYKHFTRLHFVRFEISMTHFRFKVFAHNWFFATKVQSGRNSDILSCSSASKLEDCHICFKGSNKNGIFF